MKKRKITFPADLDYLFRVRDFIRKTGVRNTFTQDEIHAVMLAAEEVCTNIIRHGYQDVRNGRIQIKAIVKKSKFVLIITDQGQTFNPDNSNKPDLDQYVKNRKVGGLGILMIKKMVDEIKYKVSRQGNEFHLIKYREKYKNSLVFKFKQLFRKAVI